MSAAVSFLDKSYWSGNRIAHRPIGKQPRGLVDQLQLSHSLALGTINRNLEVTKATSAMVSVFNHGRLVGKTVTEILPGSAAAISQAFELAASDRLLPDRHFSAHGRDYQASFHAMHHPSGSVSELLMIATDVTKRVALERQLRETRRRLVAANRRDHLTGLLNRRGLDVVLHRQLRRARRTGRPLSLLVIDIDWFKSYNDHLGHPEGDACLKAVAGVIVGSLRSGVDAVCRHGGEEFVVVLPDMDATAASIIADQCRRAIVEAEMPHPRSRYRFVTASIGVAETRATATGISSEADAHDLLGRADLALYAAKGKGRNCVQA